MIHLVMQKDSNATMLDEQTGVYTIQQLDPNDKDSSHGSVLCTTRMWRNRHTEAMFCVSLQAYNQPTAGKNLSCNKKNESVEIYHF